MENQFKILASRSGKGQLRRGELITDHGSIQTPAVIPFAKRGAVIGGGVWTNAEG